LESHSSKPNKADGCRLMEHMVIQFTGFNKIEIKYFEPG
jgi:hypothetical protein